MLALCSLLLLVALRGALTLIGGRKYHGKHTHALMWRTELSHSCCGSLGLKWYLSTKMLGIAAGASATCVHAEVGVQ